MEDWPKVTRWVFARHSNPWSMWSRWASAPLLLVPVWRRSRHDAALVALWMAVNPVVFSGASAEALVCRTLCQEREAAPQTYDVP